MPGTSQPQDLGTISYKDIQTQAVTSKQSVKQLNHLNRKFY